MMKVKLTLMQVLTVQGRGVESLEANMAVPPEVSSLAFAFMFSLGSLRPI